MPLFYFVPFKLTSSAEKKSEVPVIELGPTRDVVLFVFAALVFFGMFFGLVVLPAIMAIRATTPPAA